jgi:serine protease AprX
VGTWRMARTGAGRGLVASIAVSALAVSGLPAVSRDSSGVPGRLKDAWQSTTWNGPGTPVRLTDVGKTIGARTGDAATMDGTGIGVALIDTGVVPDKGLPASRIVNGPDLSLESQTANLRYLDTYGHGSHMAGIIAGETLAYGFRGVAPKVKLTSIKVGTATGVVDVTQVMAAVDWVVAHRNDDPANPIRVINLSYGTPSTQDALVDPLSFAFENAWRAGIVVVAAGGNAGSSSGQLTDPAYNRYVLSVGSVVTQGTLDQTDDTVSDFTSVSGVRNIDVLAPGEVIESSRVVGSYVDDTYPGARTDYGNFRGSGTSQAAAAVSGAVALILQKRPTLKPDQVKALITSSATQLRQKNVKTAGIGEINVAAALAKATPTTTQTWARGAGTGSIEKARGGTHIVYNSTSLAGETDVFGKFDVAAWAKASAAGTSWKGGVWMGHRMAGDGWTGTSTASKTWAAGTWPITVFGKDALADSDWSGHYWSGDDWSGHYWSGSDWSGHYWSSNSWPTW